MRPDFGHLSPGLELSDIAIACHHVTLEPSDALETNRTVCCAGPHPKTSVFTRRSVLIPSRAGASSRFQLRRRARQPRARPSARRSSTTHSRRQLLGGEPPPPPRESAMAVAVGGRGRWCGTPIRRGRCRGRPPRTPHTDWGPAPRESSRAAVAGRCCAC